MFISSICNPLTYLFTRNNTPRKISFPQPQPTEAPSLKNRIAQNPAYKIPEAEIKEILNAIDKSKNIFKDLKKDQINQLLNAWVERNIDRPEKYMQFLNIMSDQDLLRATQVTPDRRTKLIEQQSNLTQTALKSVINVKAKAFYKRVLPEIWHMTRKIVHDGISQMGFFDLEGDYQWGGGTSRYEAEQSVALYKQIFYLYPIAIFEIISSYLPNVLLSVVATCISVCFTLMGLSLYVKYMQPCPKKCYGLENLSLPENLENPLPVIGRDNIYAKIKAAFEADKGVLIIGDRGTGKTRLVEGLAQKFADGEFGDKFKKVQLQKCTTSGLIRGYGFNSPNLAIINQVFKKHSQEVVFFLDEIHAAFRKPGDQQVIDTHTVTELLPFCDKFKWIIGATTTQEFKDLIATGQNEPFLRRFVEPIFLEELSQDQLEVALYDLIDKENSQLILENGVVEYIRDQANKFQKHTSQIDAAVSLLRASFVKLNTLKFETIENEITRLTTELAHAERTYCHGTAGAFLEAAKDDPSIELNKKALAEKRAELAEKNQKLAKLKKIESIYQTWKKDLFLLANQITKQNTSTRAYEWHKRVLVLSALEKTIMEQRTSLGLPRCLDKALIQSLLPKSETYAKSIRPTLIEPITGLCAKNHFSI